MIQNYKTITEIANTFKIKASFHLLFFKFNLKNSSRLCLGVVYLIIKLKKLIIQFNKIIVKILRLKNFEIIFIILLLFSLIREISLNGIWEIKNNATSILVAFKKYALFKFPFDNSQNALVVPQTGHSTPIILSIRQK